MKLLTEETRTQARMKLEQAIERGRSAAGPVMARVFSDIPQDSIMKHSALAEMFTLTDAATPKLGERGIHKHAFGQIVERAGIPAQYARTLADPKEGWRRELLTHMVRESYTNQPSKYLIRQVGTEVRGVLSDRFRRLDSRPLLDAFVQVADSVGAVPYNALTNDVKTSVRYIVPRVVEVSEGEYIVQGLAWQNSDFGAGRYEISSFVLRLICLNGATATSELKQVHLGRALSDQIEYSDRTYALDTQTMVSATKDMVRGLLSEQGQARFTRSIQAVQGQEATWAGALKRLGSGLSKADEQAAKAAFEGPDEVMLPAGKTLWRASNALSWLANTTEDSDRKMELQQASGKLLVAA